MTFDPHFALPEPQQHLCMGCGNNMTYGEICEECIEYNKAMRDAFMDCEEIE